MRFNKKATTVSTKSWSLMAVICGLTMVMLLPLCGCGPADAPNATNETVQDDSHDDHDHEDHEDHDDHDHDHKSASLSESVGELGKTFAEIAEGFAKDDAESVHHQLHEVGHLLKAIEAKVNAGEGIVDGKQETATQTVAALFENFMTLDDSLHGKEDADTTAAVSKISDGLKQLKEVMQ
jgi:hypothetical protein